MRGKKMATSLEETDVVVMSSSERVRDLMAS